MYKGKILVTGGEGRFAKVLKEKNKLLNLHFATKKNCNILKLRSIENIVRKVKPKIIIHCAGLSRPMNIHEKNITKSIDLNIIGTSNITKICSKYKIKLIYFSTGYVYEGKKGNYSEKDPVKPFNNYGLSKLGGECAVAMYKNSLILRITMTEKPFVHKKAYSNLKSNFMFHEDLVKILPKIKNIMIQLMIDINASLLKISLLYKKSSLFKCIYNNITCIQADIEVAKARKA